MSDTTITSANSIFTITIPDLFDEPVQMRGYSTDKGFMTDSVGFAEVQMGVDGRMTAGYTPNPTTQTITLQADSPSKFVFTELIQATKSQSEIFYIFANITLPSTGEVIDFYRGVLTKAKQMPDAAKVLQPQDYEITWESIDVSSL
jgi:hypothetical protein